MAMKNIIRAISAETGYRLQDTQSIHIPGKQLTSMLKTIDALFKRQEDYSYMYTCRPSYKDHATISIVHIPSGVSQLYMITSSSKYIMSSFNFILASKFKGIVRLSDMGRVCESVLEYSPGNKDVFNIYHVLTKDRLRFTIKEDGDVEVEAYGEKYPLPPMCCEDIIYTKKYFKNKEDIDENTTCYYTGDDVEIVVKKLVRTTAQSKIFKRIPKSVPIIARTPQEAL